MNEEEARKYYDKVGSKNATPLTKEETETLTYMFDGFNFVKTKTTTSAPDSAIARVLVSANGQVCYAVKNNDDANKLIKALNKTYKNSE